MAHSLDDYERKRDFKKTPEPAAVPLGRDGKAPVFVIHRHEARRLHYDLRLEMEGVLRSWAVPKGFSYDPKDKHLAVRTEDHPIAYEDFEGVIPMGEYGAGTMLIWDSGVYRSAMDSDVVADVEKGELKVILEGSRLRGEWHLVKTSGGPNHWLLFKARDRYAGRNPFARGIDFGGAKVAAMPKALRAMRAGSTAEPFRDPSWVFELRFEGRRVLAVKHGDGVRFRGGRGLERKLPELVAAISGLAAENAVIDGVLVCLDAHDRPSRAALDARLSGNAEGRVLLMAFDLPFYEDWDLRRLPLLERKAALHALVPQDAVLQYVEHVAADGETFARTLASAGLPGAIAKRADGAYRGGASEDWLDVPVEPAAGTATKSFHSALEASAAQVPFTNLGKVFWPDDGFTKGDLLAFYGQVADWLLPYIQDRPIHLNRFPDGIDGKSFYQKQVPAHFPDWIETEVITSESSGKSVRYAICNDRATLLYLVNTGSIELHPWLSRRRTPDSPDWALIDLDPKRAPFSDVVKIARGAGKLLRRIGLRPYLKTSGKTGLHIVVPLLEGYGYEHSRMFCEGIARVLVRELGDIATITRDVAARGPKVYIDYLQNRRGQTIVPPYCVRPVPGAQVSAPLDWDELDGDLSLAQFTIETMPARLARTGDLYAAALTDRQDLMPAIEALQAYVGG